MSRRRVTAAVAALATLAVLAGGGGAVAAWNATASVSATASSTTIGTSLTQSGQLSTSYRYTGTSSAIATGSLTIANTGGAPLSYTLANQVTGSPTLAQKTALVLWTGTCGTSIPANGATVTTLGDPAPVLPAAARTLAAGASVTVCVATRITGADGATANAALQGQSVTAAFRVTGAVGTSWTTTATTAALTQDVYRLASPTRVACAPAGSRTVTLSWSAPANRTTNASVAYRVYDTATGTDVATVTSTAATASVTLDGYDFTRNGTYTLAVEAKEGAYGTTAPASATVSVVRSTTFLFFPGTTCS